MRVGLVLSGGGIRGIMHLGVIKALQEAAITIHQLSGTSAGALVGALYAYGYQPDEIRRFIKEVSLFQVLRPSFSGGLLKMDPLLKVLKNYLPTDDFSALKIPMTLAATDFTKGAICYFSEGELLRPIMASCCVPVVFEPIRMGQTRYVDGGLMDNLPVTCIQDKVDFIIGSHCNPINSQFDAKNVRRVMERSLLIAINGNTDQSKKQCDVVIEPISAGNYSGFDLKKVDEIFDIGYRYTQSLMPAIHAALNNKNDH